MWAERKKTDLSHKYMENPRSFRSWLYLLTQTSDTVSIWGLQDGIWLMTCFQKNVIGWLFEKGLWFFFSAFPQFWKIHWKTYLQDIAQRVSSNCGLTRQEDADSLIFAFPQRIQNCAFHKTDIQKDSECISAGSWKRNKLMLTSLASIIS